MKDNSSLFTKIFLIFLSLFSIPLILICIALSLYTNNFYLILTKENMQSALSTTVKNAEAAFDAAEKIVVSVTSNEKLMQAFEISSKKNLNADEIYVMYDAWELLSALTVGNRNITSVLIYNHRNGDVISSDKRLTDISEHKTRPWYQAYLQNPDSLVWAADYANQTEAFSQIPVIAMVYPSASFDGSIVVNIPIGYLVEHVSENDDLFLMLPEGDTSISMSISKEPVLRQEAREKIKQRILSDSKRRGSFSILENGEKLIVSYDTSDYTNIRFVSIRSEMKAYQRISNLSRFLILFALLMVLIGVFICYFLSKRFYSPIQKIVNDIKHRIHAGDFGKSEWKYIEAAIDQFSKQETEMQALQEKKKSDERIMLMKQIVSDSIENWEDYYGIFGYTYYTVVIVKVDSEDEFHLNYAINERSYAMNLVLALAKNIISPKVGLVCDGFIGENSVILLVNSQTEKIDRKLLELMLSETKKILNASVSIAVGEPAEAGNVSNSLESAKGAFLQKYFLGNGKVIFSEIPDEFELDIELDETCFLNDIKLLNREAVFSQLQKIVDNLRQIRNAEFAKQQLWLVVHWLLRCAKEYKIDQSLLTNQQSVLSEFMSCETIEEAHTMLCDLSERIMKYFEVLHDENTYRKKILDYVNAHYNEDIDVYTMAYNLNISYSLLRRLFIECTGENIILYINRMRVEKAKELLKNRDKSLQEIAVEIGYNTTQSFNRNFKRFESITPGEYRKRMG